MDPEEIRTLLFGGELVTPYAIVAGGKTYRVTDPGNVFVPADYPNTLVVAQHGRGLAWIGLGSITAIRAEHEPAGVAR